LAVQFRDSILGFFLRTHGHKDNFYAFPPVILSLAMMRLSLCVAIPSSPDQRWEGTSPIFEIALMLVRFDHVAGIIVKANQSAT
jgi:hypothetical protein